MKILITGAGGQLGTEIIKILSIGEREKERGVERGIEYKGVDKNNFDITDKKATENAIISYNPDAVIHCAAYTNVEKAEEEPELCRLINEEGTKNIAYACKNINAKMMYISTDYIFSGDGHNFYKTDDLPNPLSIYGKSKHAGEAALLKILKRAFIVRTSWVFGAHGNNFVKTMLQLCEKHSSLNIVCDQIGSPTYTADLAPLLCDIITTEQYGIYHATNEGTCSWADFATEIFRHAKKDVRINPIPASEYPSKAMRPHNSRLDKECLIQSGFYKLPHWTDALDRYFKVSFYR